MRLAGQGCKVLLVDRATFPSDTISTHIIWPHGAEILARWGLLGSLAATGAPPIYRPMTFDVGPFALRGAIPDANDGMRGLCPRRTVLDSLLANAAAAIPLADFMSNENLGRIMAAANDGELHK